MLGSGKTAAFLIPILSRIFEEGPPPLPDVSGQIVSFKIELKHFSVLRVKFQIHFLNYVTH